MVINMAHKCLLDSATKVVINVVELDDNVVWTPPEGTELAPEHSGGIGDTWDGEKFIRRPDPPLTLAFVAPTKEELLAQLQALQAQISALP